MISYFLISEERASIPEFFAVDLSEIYDSSASSSRQSLARISRDS